MNLAEDHLGVAQVDQNGLESVRVFEVCFMFAMCAILGLCPDWQDWGPDGVKNAQTAMDKAEEYLGVPKV